MGREKRDIPQPSTHDHTDLPVRYNYLGASQLESKER